MKVLKVILIIIIVLVGGFAIWMATLDGKYDVKRTAFIEATPELVYAEVSDFKTWPEWGPWFAKDSTMKAQFGDQTQGKGATYSWTSENQGSGSMEIVEADPGKSMETKINFGGMGSSNGHWTFTPKDGGTEVTWGFKGEMPFFFRFMAANMDAGVGPDFETGLTNLKELLESRKPRYEFTEFNLQPTAIYYTHHESLPMSTMTSEWFGSNWGMIAAYLGEDMKNTTGAPMSIMWDWNEEAGTFSADLAIPCASDKPGNDIVLK
jgi:ribosome-associated toxin RatA of RatAB toxin-antitoxin module